MYLRVLKNTSKSVFKSLFGKDQVRELALTETGFVVIMEKAGAIEIPFNRVKALPVNFYFEKITPYRTLTVLAVEGERYALNLNPDIREIDAALEHFARYQLGGGIPERIEQIDLMLQEGLNDSSLRLQSGALIESKQGNQTEYPWSSLQYYRVEKIAGLIYLKFENKKMFLSFSPTHLSNTWLFLRILEKFSKAG